MFQNLNRQFRKKKNIFIFLLTQVNSASTPIYKERGERRVELTIKRQEIKVKTRKKCPASPSYSGSLMRITSTPFVSSVQSLRRLFSNDTEKQYSW
jgi:hypothetical protein